MPWFINDISFTGQFPTNQSFLDFIKKILTLRNTNKIVKEQFYCSRMLPELLAVKTLTVRDVINTSSDRYLKRLVLEWMNKKGPFLDDIRAPVLDDDFELFDKIVTEQGAGEATRQKLNGNYSALYSVDTPEFNCCETPLIVYQITSELEAIGHSINNVWDLNNLIENMEAQIIPPSSWRELIEYADTHFQYLVLHNSIINVLSSQPFNKVICSQAINILTILNRFVSSRDANGEYSEETRTIFSDFFSGDGAIITDESQTNRTKYEDKMTFIDPSNSDNAIFCSWHGKISHRYFRIHFEFPLPSERSKMAVCYIGPKLATN